MTRDLFLPGGGSRHYGCSDMCPGVLELDNEAGPVPIIYKWPWPWPSAAAVGPHRSRSRFRDFDARKAHPRNVAPPFFLSVSDAVRFVVRKQVSKEMRIVRPNHDRPGIPPRPRHLGCGCHFGKARVVIGNGASCSERCIVRERFSAVRRLSKTVVGHKRCSRRRAVCPKRGSFFGRRPTLGITGRI